MFYYIDGTVAELGAQMAVIDCNGVGFMLNTTSNTVSRLKTGSKARLYVFSYIREDSFDLYGFFSLGEKRSFELLLGVSGVGPKAALSILSSTTPENLAMSIVGEDTAALTVAPGIGKKIAQRIILELKDKISKETQGFTAISGSGKAAASGEASNLNDAVAALAVLGYAGTEIAAAVKGLNTDGLTTEEIIKHALRQMMIK